MKKTSSTSRSSILFEAQPDDGETTGCEGVRKLGRNAIAIPLDCTDPVHVGSAFKQVRDALGPIDICLIISYGIDADVARRSASSYFHLFWCSIQLVSPAIGDAPRFGQRSRTRSCYLSYRQSTRVPAVR
jgi:NAD(P)-dependent dehydrogenase (short-subunit alcohol dehydrogenase family)